MSAVFDALITVTNETGRPVAEVLRHHFLEAVLRRLPVGDPAFVLRGSALTRVWVAPFPRPANDLDFLGTFPHSVAATADRFLPALAAELPDGVRFDVPRCTTKGIWEGSEFPGVRLTLFADVVGEPHVTTVDVGFGDPLVPPAAVVEYPWTCGGAGGVWATHPATLIAWKLHGLAEWGHTRWRPKDMLDLWLLLDAHAGRIGGSVLAEAVREAFRSRHYDPADARRSLEDPRWQTFAAQARWARFRDENPDLPLPESLASVRDAVSARLAPALSLLP